MGYSKQIIKGFSWSAILNALAMAISLVKIIALSHFVFEPVEFGIFGVGILVLGILELLTETGINVFLVQEKEPLEKYLDTAWVISILRGCVIALALAILSYPISVFFKIGSSWTFVLAFSAVPLVRGFLNPAIANLQKKLLFRKDAIFRFLTSATEDIFIVLFAFATHSIFSFIFGMLAGVFVEIILTFTFVKERPKLNFKKAHFRQIVSRGKWVTLALIFDYLFEHTDDLVVGRILNVFSLGIYQNSYTLSSLPENAIAQQLGKITFPVFVNIQGDVARLRKAFWKMFLITFVIIAPFGVILFLFSDSLVRILLGAKWLPAIPVLRVLSLFGVARAMTNLFYPVFLAFKRQNYITITTLVSWFVLGIFILPLSDRYGITGAALSALIGSLAGLPVAYVLCRSLF